MGYPSLNYKQRLLELNLLPLTLWFELQDVLLFLHLVKFPPDNYSLPGLILCISLTQVDILLLLVSSSLHLS